MSSPTLSTRVLLPFLLTAGVLVGCGDKDDGTVTDQSGDTGEGDPTECDTDVDADCDGVPDSEDCDPDDPWVYQGATEIPYDGKDNDCSGDGDLTDVDGDGYDGTSAEGGDDCNDNNPDIHPGAEDECYDGVDQDCDGVPATPDDETTDCDGDGYVGIGTEATDCDDLDPDVNPEATEVWYDGVDQDCLFDSDYDADGDGEDAMGYDGVDGTDCDDTDDTVNSEAPELWDDQDNNCDDIVDTMSIFDADYSWFANTSSDDGYFGMSAAALGDLDGDGMQEFGMGGPLSGADGSQAGWFQTFNLADGDGIPSSMAETRLYNANDGAWFGWDAATMDDYDGDGLPEIAIGSPLHDSTGSVFLFGSTIMGSGSDVAQGNSLVRFYGVTYAGFVVNNAGDINGDGNAELVTSGTDFVISVFNGVTLTGAVWDVQAALDAGGGDISSSDALATITSGNAKTGGELVGGSDYDGDGLAELLVGVNVDAGGSLVVIPATDMTGGAAIDVADYPRFSGGTGDMTTAHLTLMSDLDGDGVDDLAVAAPGEDGAGSGSGTVYVVAGADAMGDSEAIYDMALATLEGNVSSGGLSLVGETAGDFDDDDAPDLVMADTALVSSGVTPTAYLVMGSVFADGGTYVVQDEAMAFFASRTADDWFGHSGLVFDADSDGDDDLLIGAPNNNVVGMAALYLNRYGE